MEKISAPIGAVPGTFKREINVPLMPRPDPSLVEISLDDEEKYLSCDQIKAINHMACSRRVASSGSDIPLLIVDDDELIRNALVSFCRDNGVRYEIARNGKEALDKIASSLTSDLSSSYQLVILDNHMPAVHGVEVAEVLNAHRININIAVHSSGLTEEDCQRFRAAGCQKFLNKPSVASELLETCKEAAIL